MNVPPPPYAPPPVRSSTGKTWGIVIGILLFFFLACAGLGWYGFGRVTQISKEDPKPLPGFGKPRPVRKGKGGWSTYALKDLGMEVELPEAPKPAKVEWTPEYRLSTETWSYYDAEAIFFYFEVDAFRFRFGVPLSRQDLAETQRDSYKMHYPDLKEETVETKIAGKPALRQRLTYKEEGESVLTEAYHFHHRDLAMGVRFTYHAELAEDIRPQIERVLKSIRFAK